MGAQPAFAADLEINTVETDEAPSFEAIRLRSQEIWEREGRPEGRAEEHWARARAELAELMARTANAPLAPRAEIAEPVLVEPETAAAPAEPQDEPVAPEEREPEAGAVTEISHTPDKPVPVAPDETIPAVDVPAALPSLRLPLKRSNAPTGAPSIISHGIELCGTLQSPGEIHFNGFIEGTLCGASLIVDEDGAVEGEVYADEVTVRGRVKGRIFARKVLLCAGCRVEGDILHGSLTIEMGAQLDAAFQRWEPAQES